MKDLNLNSLIFLSPLSVSVFSLPAPYQSKGRAVYVDSIRLEPIKKKIRSPVMKALVQYNRR
jgi:hypothetical protein